MQSRIFNFHLPDTSATRAQAESGMITTAFLVTRRDKVSSEKDGILRERRCDSEHVVRQ